jgi:voltage-gated potassium channel
MSKVQKSLLVIAGVILADLILGTVGFVMIEHADPFEAFYMTLITLTTIGYGETVQLDRTGRIFNSFLIFFGVISMLLAIGALTQIVIEMELNQYFGKRRIKNMIDQLENHFILCGFGRVGRGAAEELNAAMVPFVVLDSNEEKVERAMKAGFLAVLADANQDENLKDVGIERARGLIATLGTDADNLFLILSAKALNAKLQLSARIDEESSEHKMRRAGADFVFAPYNTTGHTMAQALLKPHVHALVNLNTKGIGQNITMEQIRVDSGCAVEGQTLSDMHVNNKIGVIVLGVRRANGEMLFNPPHDQKLSVGDYLIVMGEMDPLEEMRQLLSER